MRSSRRGAERGWFAPASRCWSSSASVRRARIRAHRARACARRRRAAVARARDRFARRVARATRRGGRRVARCTGVDSASARRQVRAAFVDARTRFKHIEGVVEFYAPALAASLNSRRQEVDDDDAPPPSTLAPGGFPALEPIVWPAVDRDSVARARILVDGMRRVVARVRALSGALSPTDAQLIELARLEVARVSTLGIAGFDAPLTRASMREAADALDGVRLLYAERWRRRGGRRSTRERARDRFDVLRAPRAICARIRTSSRSTVSCSSSRTPSRRRRAIDALRRAAGTTSVRIPRGWRADVASVYDAGAFDPRAYAATDAPAPTPAIVALGKRLFSEPALSGTGTRSCASCHVAVARVHRRTAARGANRREGSRRAAHADAAERRARAGAVRRRARRSRSRSRSCACSRVRREMASSVERAAAAVARRVRLRRRIRATRLAAPPTAR